MGRGRSGLSIRAAIEQGAARGREKRRAKIDLDNFSPLGVLLNQGEGALKRTLNSLNEQDLRKIIRGNRWDPSNLTRRMKDVDSLREFIIQKAKKRATQGDAFRFYG